jgi:hypothetical protein
MRCELRAAQRRRLKSALTHWLFSASITDMGSARAWRYAARAGAVALFGVLVGRGIGDAQPPPTFTPFQTFTPFLTFTPFKTFTPVLTFTPVQTETPVPTSTLAFARTATGTRTLTATQSRTPTPTPTPNTTATAPGTRTRTATRRTTGTPARCPGDCDGDGHVTISDLITGVQIVLGNLSLAFCPSIDTSGDGVVTVDELIGSINHALFGCP